MTTKSKKTQGKWFKPLILSSALLMGGLPLCAQIWGGVEAYPIKPNTAKTALFLPTFAATTGQGMLN